MPGKQDIETFCAGPPFRGLILPRVYTDPLRGKLDKLLYIVQGPFLILAPEEYEKEVDTIFWALVYLQGGELESIREAAIKLMVDPIPYPEEEE